MTKRLLGTSDASEFELDVARGVYPNVTYINKFGLLPSQDTGDTDVDIWEFGGSQPVYIFPDIGTAPIDSISSSDAGDTMVIEVIGLDINGLEVTQYPVLNGQNRVALETPLWRCFRMANFDTNMVTGKGADIAGTVYCYENTAITAGVPDDTDKVRAVIIDGNNQTQMAIYTIPMDKVGYILSGEIGIQKSGGVATSGIMCYRSRAPGFAFRIFKTFAVGSTGSSHYKDNRDIWDPIPPGTDIKICSREVASNGSQVWGTFTIVLVDEATEAQAHS